METPSPTLPEAPVVADFDALTRAARQERCLSENTLLGVPRGRGGGSWRGAAPSKLDPVTLTQEQAGPVLPRDGGRERDAQLQAARFRPARP